MPIPASKFGYQMVGENRTHFDLAVGEPWDFDGPDGSNRIMVDCIGRVKGPQENNWSGKYLLLTVRTPFVFMNELVDRLVAFARYEGETLDKIERYGGTVGVARVRPGVKLAANDAFQASDVDYIIIGALRKC